MILGLEDNTESLSLGDNNEDEHSSDEEEMTESIH